MTERASTVTTRGGAGGTSARTSTPARTGTPVHSGTPSGSSTPSGAETPSGADAAALLREMIRIRRFEEKCAELYSASRIRGFLHLCIGEEAVAVGVVGALEEW